MPLPDHLVMDIARLGFHYHNKLATAITSNTPDKVESQFGGNIADNLEEYYNTGIKHGWMQWNFHKSEWDYLANNFNIEIDRDDFTVHNIIRHIRHGGQYEHNSPDSRDRSSILKMRSCVDQGLIIVEQSWGKVKDCNNPKLTWSEMLFHNWFSLATGSRAKSLRYIVRHIIVTPQFEVCTTGLDGTELPLNTKEAIEWAFEKMPGSKTEKILVLDVHTSDDLEKWCVGLMLAQTHVSRVVMGLMDNHRRLGDLYVSRMHLVHPHHKDSEWHHLVLELQRHSEKAIPMLPKGAVGDDLASDHAGDATGGA